MATEVIAWYGAVVATLSAVVAAYAVWRDRASLRVTATPDMRLLEPPAGYSADETYIIIEASNVGRRAIVLQKFPYFRLRGRSSAGPLVKGPWQPKARLEEGESANIIALQRGFDIPVLGRVVVKDATGREWTGRIRRPS